MLIKGLLNLIKLYHRLPLRSPYMLTLQSNVMQVSWALFAKLLCGTVKRADVLWLYYVLVCWPCCGCKLIFD